MVPLVHRTRWDARQGSERQKGLAESPSVMVPAGLVYMVALMCHVEAKDLVRE